MYLTKQTKVIRAMNAVAAGTTTQNGSGIDMRSGGACFGSICFIAAFGTLTATQVTSLKAQQSDDDGSSDDYSDIEGSAVGPLDDGDGNKVLVLDLKTVSKRYVRPVVVRGTANAVIDGVIAIQYNPSVSPVSQDNSTVAGSDQIDTRVEGTA